MLVALTKNGDTVTLTQKMTKQSLLSLRQREEFYCPICHAKVILKLGRIKLWHFAHAPHHVCHYHFENESRYHLQGKQDLYHWLTHRYKDVLVEHYLPLIQQRPDLYFQNNNQWVAIEYQCSAIDEQLLAKRTNAYIKQKISPIWILGGNRLKRKSQYEFKISTFEWQCIRTFNHSPYLLYFCSETKQWCILCHILPVSSETVIALPHFLPLGQMPNPSQKVQTDVLSTYWNYAKKRWRLYHYRYKSHVYHYIRKQLKPYYLDLGYVPSICGVPLSCNIAIRTSPFLWQTWLLILFITPLSVGDRFSIRFIEKKFLQMVEQQVFVLRRLPSFPSSFYKQALIQYMNYLEHVGYIKKVNEHFYIKCRKIVYPLSLEQAIKEDAEATNHFFETCSNWINL